MWRLISKWIQLMPRQPRKISALSGLSVCWSRETSPAKKMPAASSKKCYQWQRLDILVNNAGISRDKSMRKMTDDDWADVINVNLNGTFYCTSAAVPAMINPRFGRII